MPGHEIERIGVMIHRAMSAQQRSFHTPDHIFSLIDRNDPHSTLAALFHDLVYYHVDEGFDPDIETLIGRWIRRADASISIIAKPPADARVLRGCMAVFGFEAGQQLSPYGGLNEFLSALAMDLLLVDTLSDMDLMTATAYVEATIPFRGPDNDGVGPADRLAHRLARVVSEFELDADQSRVDAVTAAAVLFANRDVENFAEEEVGRFLDNTWKLLPETNPSLRVTGVYTIRSYGTALMKMERFMSVLDPRTIFQRYGDTPDEASYRSLVDRATRNVTDGRRYLQVKLVTAGILWALATLSGGDAPVAFFMGEINPDDPGSALTAHMPAISRVPKKKLNATVFDLLAHGRAGRSAFDMQQSPLSLLVYTHLGDAALDAAIDGARELIAGSHGAEAFLDSLSPELVHAVASGAARMAFTRRDALTGVADGALVADRESRTRRTPRETAPETAPPMTGKRTRPSRT